MAGQVRVTNPTKHQTYTPQQTKPGTLFPEECEIFFTHLPKFVSRGGEKLEAALNHWNIEISNNICLDIGSSTGGFSDCLLQRGVKKIYCVDVGHGQMHPKIRNDPRVALFEDTHFLRWEPSWKNEPPSFAAIDVSFISLEKILFRVYELGKPNLEVLALIKPQFEVGAKFIQKGIVRDPEARQGAIKKVLDLALKTGFNILGSYACPVLGAKGNREEWGYLKKQG